MGIDSFKMYEDMEALEQEMQLMIDGFLKKHPVENIRIDFDFTLNESSQLPEHCTHWARFKKIG